ncbi:MAG TPA: hypothetical protein VM580_09325, partial [Labilithrix sp.]|nr:hypothetical protein [Labilithrix sp.]
MGGEGLGGAVDDPAVRNLLASPSSTGSDEGFKFLYAYADTVFPRGTLAPLLMWDWSTGDADAIRLTVETTSGSFSWTGTFGRPVILAITGGKFVRHPIPQNVWKAASETAGALLPDGTRDRLTVSRSGVAYGPISQTYTIAPGRLSGIVYYSSYGTQYAKNYTGALGGDGTFGGTTLSIRIGDSSTYPGISPDGALALTAGGKILELPNAATALPTTGLMASNIGTPAFAPNGRLVAFNPMASGTIEKPKQKLYVAAFDPATREFGENILVVDNSGSPAQTRPGWPG